MNCDGGDIMAMLSNYEHLRGIKPSAEALPDLCNSLVVKVKMGIISGRDALDILKVWISNLSL